MFDFEVAPGGKLPATHFHPQQDETFTVHHGSFVIKVGEEVKTLTAGSQYTIPHGVPHQWWNPSNDEPVAMTVTFQPALNTETFLEQFFGLGNDNKTNVEGVPSFMQMMAMINEYQLYIAGPPLAIQKIMGVVLGSIARLMGYKKFYAQYSQ